MSSRPTVAAMRAHPLYWQPLDVPYTLERAALPWQRSGLSYTATGYGAAIPSYRVAVLPNGQRRRVYVTCYANAGTAWINYGGTRRIVRD